MGELENGSAEEYKICLYVDNMNLIVSNSNINDVESNATITLNEIQNNFNKKNVLNLDKTKWASFKTKQSKFVNNPNIFIHNIYHFSNVYTYFLA